MSKTIKWREYFFAWIVLVSGTTGVFSLFGFVLDFFRSWLENVFNLNPRGSALIIIASCFVLGLATSFIIFAWIVNWMIVRKVEKRVREAQQTETPQQDVGNGL